MAFFVFAVNVSCAEEPEIQFDKLQEKIGEKASFSTDKSTGKLDFVSADGGSLPLDLSSLAKKDPEKIASQFMKEYSDFFGLKDAEKELGAGKAQKDKLGMTHVRFQQNFEGVPVFGGEGIVHLKKDLAVKSANGRFVSDISIDTKPKISEEEARQYAKKEWKKQFGSDSAESEKSTLYIFNKELIESKKDGENLLVWQVELNQANPKRREFFFIDARNGELVFQITGIQKAINRRIYDCSLGACGLDNLFGGYFFGRSEGQPVRGTNPIYGGTDVDNLYGITSNMHNYLSARFSRNGGNGLGGIGDGSHSAATNTDGFAYIDPMFWTDCPNAFFSGYDINFCKGLIYSDVVGHEYGHGVVEFSVPGGLTYSYEPGALNESYADLFGESLENYSEGSSDWLCGEDVNLPGLVGPLRSMSNPSSVGAYPNKFYDSNYYCGSSDGGGVHTNSSVPNHAAYLMAMGGSYNGCSISGIGRERTEQIFYRALTTYFTSSSDFGSAYNALNSSCADLYGSGSSYCTNVTKALQSVEMDQDGQCSGVAQLEPLCDTVAPVISGVEEGAVYTQDVTPTFDHGTATLNDAGFSSGTVVSANGNYTLTATDRPGNSTTVHFVIKKFESNVPTLNYSASKKVKTTITVTFYNQNISPKKNKVRARLGGRKVSVKRVSKSGSTLRITINFKYGRWPVGSYTLVATYNYKVKKTRFSGSLTADGVLTII